MNAIPFDTLKLARKLEASGFTRDQATGAAEAFADAMVQELATKADLEKTEHRLEAKITEAKAELKAEIGDSRSELKAETSDIRAEMKLLEQRMTIKLGGMMIVGVGVLLAAIRYLPAGGY